MANILRRKAADTAANNPKSSGRGGSATGKAAAGKAATGKASGRAANATTPPAAKTSRIAQLREAFTLTRKRDKRLLPMMGAAFVVGLGVFEIIGLILGQTIIFTIFGVLGGVLAAFILFGRRAQSSALAEIEGQPGAAAAVISTLRGDWRLTPNVAATRNMDVVHRVVGKPGVVLIGEGSTERLQPLLTDQQKRVQRVAAGTPVSIFIVGREPGQIPLSKLQQKMTRLPRTFKGVTVDQIEGRMRALGTLNVPIPKGPIPKGARIPKGVRPPQQG